jgi:hypothetical protein
MSGKAWRFFSRMGENSFDNLTDCFSLPRVEKKETPGNAFSVLKEGKVYPLSAPVIPPFFDR